MGEEKTITQSKFGVRLKFQFGVDEMTCSFRDYSGEAQFSTPYEAIDFLAPSTIITNNNRFVYRMLSIPIILAVVAGVALRSVSATLSGALILVGCVLLILQFAPKPLKLFAIKYTMLRAGGGKNVIRIIDDKNRSAVVDEIGSRWRGRLKQLHGNINFANDLDKEIAKFAWLKENAVLTDEEYREIVDKARAHASQNQPRPMERSLN